MQEGNSEQEFSWYGWNLLGLVGVALSCCCLPEEFQKVEVVVKGRVGSRSFWKAGKTPGTVWTEQEAQFSVSCVALCLQLLGAPVGTKLPNASGIFICVLTNPLGVSVPVEWGNAVFNILILLRAPMAYCLC